MEPPASPGRFTSSQGLGDQNYSNEVTASGEDLVTVKSVAGDTDPPFTLAIGLGNAKRLEDAHLSFNTVDRSAVDLSFSFAGAAHADEMTKATIFADVRRGVGVSPVSWASIFQGPPIDLEPGIQFQQTFSVVDFPGEPATIPIDDGHWSYSVYLTQVSGTETVTINSFEFAGTESR